MVSLNLLCGVWSSYLMSCSAARAGDFSGSTVSGERVMNSGICSSS